ncbi:MAG: hypothetical protein EXR98_23605 [Gemmataceae bacterium]|nr:hypothetical protein [Gemmataceae bacterium]
MRRSLCLLIVLLSLTAIACPPAPKVDPINKDDAKVTDKAVTPPESLDHLKPRVEAALEQVRDRDLLTTHAFWTIFHGILGTGLEKTTLTDPESKKKVNAIDYLAGGGEIRGLQFLPTSHGLDVALAKSIDLQGVAQGHQDQFIAEMAQWNMPLDRKFRVGGTDFTFQDFTRHSRMRASVKKDQELSWAVIIIAQYYGTSDVPWVNSFGETLKLSDVVRYELDASIENAACGGTHRLFGLTWAYHLHLKNGGKKEGVWLDVEKRIAEYKSKARQSQNRADGILSTSYFRSKDHEPNLELRIGTTGHIVEWLALAMTDEELKAPWMQEAVSALSLAILDMRKGHVESGALYHAAHGLHLYHERVFGTPARYLPLPPKK